jgi:SPW repeat
MWPRTVEVMLGAWLIISPFVFRDTPGADAYTVNVAVSGALVVLFSLSCFWRPLRRAHLGSLAVALWLAGHGYFSAVRPGPPAAQNELMTGLLLLLFVILPSETNEPPEPWRSPVTGR